DGKQLSYLAAVKGVLNIWVGPIDKPEEARPITNDTKRGIRSYFWAYTSKHIVYIQDTEGDEDWHVYCVNLEKNETRDLTPINRIAARIENVSHKFPEEILVNINDDEKRQFHSVYRINLLTAERKRIQKNTEFAGFLTDDDYNIRFATRFNPDG